jgi:hypothetical protein
MSSPFDVGRDSNAANSNAFSDTDSVADSHQGAFQAAFAPPPDELAEHDYRSAEHVGSADPSPDATPYQVPAAKSGDKGYPTPRPGGFINL